MLHPAPAASRPHRRLLGRAALSSVLAFALAGQAIAADYVMPAPPPADVPNGFTVLAAGDTICHFPISGYVKQRTPKLIEIIKSADVAIANFEDNAIDFKTYKGHPQAEAGGSWLVTTPGVPQDLADMGFDMMGRANNHSTDWGVEGMEMTDNFLDEAGIVHAGTGETLGAARAARYLEAKTVGRVGLVSFASSFETMSPALNALGEVPGRPGMSALHTKKVSLVSAERLKQLGDIAKAAGERVPLDATPGDVTLAGATYRAADVGDKISTTYEMNPTDVRQITYAVRQGKLGAAFQAVYMHAHEGGETARQPADFLPKIAHQAIDAGADAFFASGPHQVRGIEIYKGKPIFYSLGNFCHMDDPQFPQPQQLYDQLGREPEAAPLGDMMHYWVETMFGRQELLESVVATAKFENGVVSEIRLYPIWLGKGGRDQLRGMPLLATPEQGKTVLERIAKLSEPFGTKVTIENNVGVIRVAQAK